MNKKIKEKGSIHISSLERNYDFTFSIFNITENKPKLEQNERISTSEIIQIIKTYKETKDQDFFLYKAYPLFSKVVNKIVNKFKDVYKEVSVEDLLQCGYVGLVKAIENIDLDNFNVNPLTFIYTYIEGEIRHYLRDKKEVIKIPRVIKKIYYQIHNLLLRNPNLTVSEIANLLNIKEESVKEILNIPIKKEIDISKIRSKEFKDFQLLIEDKIFLEQIWEKLTTIEKNILNLLFYTDLTKVEISQKLNITRKKVYNIINSIKEKLFKNL